MSTNIDSNEAFDGAFRRFLESLSEAERARYAPVASPEDLLDGIKKLDLLSQRHQKTKLWRVLKCVETFSARLTPYFAIVNTVVSSNPQYAAIVWGLLKFVLQLAESFTTFFDRLVKVIAKISDAFPMYEDIVRLYTGQKSTRLRAHVEQVYSDILQFFQHVAGIFTRVDGQTAAAQERRLAAEERDCAEKARAHVEDISNQTEGIKRLINDQTKGQNFDKIHRWIKPPNYADVLERSQSIREEGTCTWLFTNRVFCRWRATETHGGTFRSINDLGPRALWINGIPGAGKTILASYIVQELHQLESADTLYCYYFFSSGSSNFMSTGAAAAYRSILSQILHHKRNDESILDKFLFAQDQGSGQLEASSSELIDLIHICSKELKELTIILDGIDECHQINELFGAIRKLMELCPMKILFLSRPGISELQDEVQASQRIVMDRFATSEDIRSYLRTSLESLASRGRLDVTNTSDLEDRLVQGANGMFLWASLMISLLWSPMLTSKSRLTIIKQVIRPEGIEQLYDRILKVIAQSKRLEKSVARVVFCWLTYARGSVSLRLLYDAIRSVNTQDDGGSHEYLPFVGETPSLGQFRENLQAVCGSLLDFDHVEDRVGDSSEGVFATVRFVHLSVKEYFQSLDDSPSSEGHLECVPRWTQGNIRLAQVCLEDIRSMTRKYSPSFQDLSNYATLHWADHLEDISARNMDGTLENQAYFHKDFADLQAALLGFLRDPYSITSWIHTLYLMHGYGDLVPPFRSLDRWVCWLRCTRATMTRPTQSLDALIALTSTFSADLRRLDETWGSRLQTDPTILWDEVAAFMQSDFIRSASNTKVKLLKVDAMDNNLQSSRALCDVSTSSADGSLCFVLSIWPSKDYETRWLTVGGQKSLEHWKDVCSGWIARYKIWNIATGETIGEIRIPIDEGEVWLQMRQSLYEQSYAEWKTAFPTAISPDGKLVVILRTLFAFDKPHGSSRLQWQETLIPVDFGRARSTKWTDELRPFDPNHPLICGRPLQFLYRDRYTYKFAFSPDSRYLAFTDKLRDAPTYEENLAIFGVLGQGKLRVDRIASRTFSSWLRRSELTICFHPCQDLVVLCAGGQVELWNFNTVANKFTNTVGARSTVIGKFSTTPPPIVDSLKISACGAYVVASHSGEPTVFEIPKLSPEVGTEEDLDIEPRFLHKASLDNNASTALSILGNTDISHFGLKHGQIIHNECIVNSKDGAVSSLVHVLSGDAPALQLVPATDGLETQTIQLMSLPKSIQLKHTAPVILTPNGQQTCIKVVLNSTIQSEYSLTERDAGVAPAVIERDIRSLKFSTVNTKRKWGITETNDPDEHLSGGLPSDHGGPSLPPSNTAPEAHRVVSGVENDEDLPSLKRQKL
ncbi:uncharacterized protein Triagg1_6288 [Trichoderma aggressivum f. europaeum]|uniref:NACHT domain-containing protein n=1 Tax=Trichoderma aggressivum f. europaeum TaxID=173218 RepID=A0AAE1M1Z0_9HYPO|nr:hypothetical protein Triagg1_6288 [Trichoderma aggressivum f. europaeum]